MTARFFYFEDDCRDVIIAVVIYVMNAPIRAASRHADGLVASNVLVTAVRFDLSRVLKAGNSSLSSNSLFLRNTSSWHNLEKMLLTGVFLPFIFANFAASLPVNIRLSF